MASPDLISHLSLDDTDSSATLSPFPNSHSESIIGEQPGEQPILGEQLSEQLNEYSESFDRTQHPIMNETQWNSLPGSELTVLNSPINDWKKGTCASDYDDDWDERLSDPMSRCGVYLGTLRQRSREPKERNVVYCSKDGKLTAFSINRSGKLCHLGQDYGTRSIKLDDENVTFDDVDFRDSLQSHCQDLESTTTFVKNRIEAHQLSTKRDREIRARRRQDNSSTSPNTSSFIDPADTEIAQALQNPQRTSSPPPGILNMPDPRWDPSSGIKVDPLVGNGVFIGLFRDRSRPENDRCVVYGSLHLHNSDFVVYTAYAVNHFGDPCRPPPKCNLTYAEVYEQVDFKQHFNGMTPRDLKECVKRRVLAKRRVDFERAQRFEEEFVEREVALRHREESEDSEVFLRWQELERQEAELGSSMQRVERGEANEGGSPDYKDSIQ